MDARLQRRVQRYGWDKAVEYYENSWKEQLEPAQTRMLEVADLKSGERVLDTACGTGLVTLRAASLVGSGGEVIGTDISATGYTVHREMALFVEAGLSPYQALTAATSEPSRYLDLEGDFGVLAVGARGDVLLLDANPLADIANTRKINGLMIRGAWWTDEMIEQELEALQREYAEDAAVLRGAR